MTRLFKWVVATILGIALACFDGFVGYLFLHTQTGWTYGDFVGMAMFGQFIVVSGLLMARLKDEV